MLQDMPFSITNYHFYTIYIHCHIKIDLSQILIKIEKFF